MKSYACISLGAAIIWLGLISGSPALDFSSQIAKKVRYPEYDAAGQLKFEVLVEQAQALPNGLIRVADLKLIFYEEGKIVMEVAAQDCLLDRAQCLASSSSAVCVTRAEMVLTGKGYVFTWQNEQGHLKIMSEAKVVLRREVP